MSGHDYDDPFDDPFAGVPMADERLADFVDDRMSGRDRERFEAELRVNPQLRQQLDDYRRTVDVLRAAMNAPTHETELADRVMGVLAAEAGRESPARRGVVPLVWAIASAAALLTVAIWVDSWGAPEKSSRDATARHEPRFAEGASDPAVDAAADGEDDAGGEALERLRADAGVAEDGLSAPKEQPSLRSAESGAARPLEAQPAEPRGEGDVAADKNTSEQQAYGKQAGGSAEGESVPEAKHGDEAGVAQAPSEAMRRQLEQSAGSEDFYLGAAKERKAPQREQPAVVESRRVEKPEPDATAFDNGAAEWNAAQGLQRNKDEGAIAESSKAAPSPKDTIGVGGGAGGARGGRSGKRDEREGFRVGPTERPGRGAGAPGAPSPTPSSSTPSSPIVGGPVSAGPTGGPATGGPAGPGQPAPTRGRPRGAPKALADRDAPGVDAPRDRATGAGSKGAGDESTEPRRPLSKQAPEEGRREGRFGGLRVARDGERGEELGLLVLEGVAQTAEPEPVGAPAPVPEPIGGAASWARFFEQQLRADAAPAKSTAEVARMRRAGLQLTPMPGSQPADGEVQREWLVEGDAKAVAGLLQELVRFAAKDAQRSFRNGFVEVVDARRSSDRARDDEGLRERTKKQVESAEQERAPRAPAARRVVLRFVLRKP